MKYINLPPASLIILFVIFFSVATFAQQEKGDKQMSLSVSFNSMSSENTSPTNSLNFQYSASKFFTKRFELGLSYAGSIQKGVSLNSLAPFMNINFLSKNGRFVFYMGAQYLLSSFSFDTVDLNGKAYTSKTTSGGIGGKIGIRSYFSDNVFLFIGPNFSAFAESRTQFDFTAGVGVLFKKVKKDQ